MLVWYNSTFLKWIHEHIIMIFLAACKSCHIYLIIDFHHGQSMLSQVNRGFSNFGTFEKTRVAKYTPNEPKTCLLLFGLSSPLFHIIANSRNISLDKVGINGNICIKGCNLIKLVQVLWLYGNLQPQLSDKGKQV